MKNFCIITNNNKDKDYVLSKKIEGFITEKGGTCFISENSDLTDEKYNYTNPDKMPENLECVITIGGDGTLLQAAQDLMSKDIVFLGINKGTLGFLAEVSVEDIEDAFDMHFDCEDIDTINGYLIYKMGKIPQDNEQFECTCDGYSFRVLEVHDRMVTKVGARREEERQQPVT